MPAAIPPQPINPPPPEPVDVADGVRLAVRRWRPTAPDPGGQPWLLVHGLASNARLWDGVAARLAAAGREAVAVDLRLHGQSADLNRDTELAVDTPTVADDLAGVLDTLGWDRAAVAGQSWGGNVVVELAHRHPERVAATAGIDGGTIRLADRFPEWDDCAAALAPPDFTGRTIGEIEGHMTSMAADWPAEGRAAALANFRVAEDGQARPWLVLRDHLRVLRGLWEHDPFAAFPHLAMPVLLVGAGSEPASDHDRHREAAFDRAVALLPDGRQQWFRPAHHDVHAQHPGLVTESLLDLESAVGR